MVVNKPPKDFWEEVRSYGASAVILVAFVLWAKPHVDNLIADHREFLKSTTVTQQQQVKILGANSEAVSRLEQTTERSAELIRDIHGQLIRRAGAARASETMKVEQE